MLGCRFWGQLPGGATMQGVDVRLRALWLLRAEQVYHHPAKKVFA